MDRFHCILSSDLYFSSLMFVVRCVIMILLLPFSKDKKEKKKKKKATYFESSYINQTKFSSPLFLAVSLLVDLLVSFF